MVSPCLLSVGTQGWAKRLSLTRVGRLVEILYRWLSMCRWNLEMSTVIQLYHLFLFECDPPTMKSGWSVIKQSDTDSSLSIWPRDRSEMFFRVVPRCLVNGFKYVKYRSFQPTRPRSNNDFGKKATTHVELPRPDHETIVQLQENIVDVEWTINSVVKILDPFLDFRVGVGHISGGNINETTWHRRRPGWGGGNTHRKWRYILGGLMQRVHSSLSIHDAVKEPCNLVHKLVPKKGLVVAAPRTRLHATAWSALTHARHGSVACRIMTRVGLHSGTSVIPSREMSVKFVHVNIPAPWEFMESVHNWQIFISHNFTTSQDLIVITNGLDSASFNQAIASQHNKQFRNDASD